MSTSSVSSITATVLVVESQPLFRSGLRHLIDNQSDLICCGEAQNAAAAKIAIGRQKPDLVLLGLSSKDGDGAEAIELLHSEFPDAPILVLSEHEEVLCAQRALNAGASGYIVKEESIEEVLIGLRTVLKSESYVSWKMASRILKEFLGTKPQNPGDGIQCLTDRELEVFQLLGKGMNTKQVAAQLNLSFKTVETYRERLKRKLGLQDATDLLHQAAAWEQDRTSAPSL